MRDSKSNVLTLQQGGLVKCAQNTHSVRRLFKFPTNREQSLFSEKTGAGRAERLRCCAFKPPLCNKRERRQTTARNIRDATSRK
jgi:hypothetical protein